MVFVARFFMKIKAFRARHVRQRWGPWLKSRLDRNDISRARLARELRPYASSENRPRSSVSGWIDCKHAISEQMAWKVGTVLQSWSDEDSGPVALYAAGYYARLIAFFWALSQRPKDAWRAVLLYCALPAAVEVLYGDPLPAYPDAAEARRVCERATKGAAQLFEDCYARIKDAEALPAAADEYTKLAFHVMSSPVDIQKNLQFAWDALMEWAITADFQTFKDSQTVFEDPLRLREHMTKLRAGTATR